MLDANLAKITFSCLDDRAGHGRKYVKQFLGLGREPKMDL